MSKRASDPHRRESFQELIGLAMAQATVEVACSLITQLCNRGALDLLEPDDEGYNVVERFSALVPMDPRVRETIELLGGHNSWAKPSNGRFLVMQNIEGWIASQAGGHNHNASHRIGAKKANEVLAGMIAQVDPAWLGLERDGGASVVNRLIGRGGDSLDCVQACWDRGADIHARLPDGTLAVSGMPTLNFLQAWMAMGGDINAPVNLHDPVPMWRHIAKQLQHAAYSSLTPTFKRMFDGMVDAKELNEECLFLDALNDKTNQASMIRHLLAIEDWHESLRPDGTPVWLAALDWRPDLLENFMSRKRARPDLTQRDHAGRSAWHAVLGVEYDATFKRLCALLEKEIPLLEHGRDNRGGGLLVQVIEGGGGLACLANRRDAVQFRFANALRLLSISNPQVNAVVLDGLNDLDFAGLSKIPSSQAQVVATKLFASRLLVERLEPGVAIELARRLLSPRLCDQNSNLLGKEEVTAVVKNVERVVLTHGPALPDRLAGWVDRLNAWLETGVIDAQREAAGQLKPKIQAIVEQARLDGRVDPVPAAPARQAGLRF